MQSKQNSRNKITSLNAWAMLVLTKGDSEIDEKWIEEPLQENQKKIIMYDALGYVVTSYSYEMWALCESVCKSLFNKRDDCSKERSFIKCKTVHFKSNVDRIYVKTNKKINGLINFGECVNVLECFFNSIETLKRQKFWMGNIVDRIW